MKQRMYLETMEEILSRPGMEKTRSPEGRRRSRAAAVAAHAIRSVPGRLRQEQSSGPSFRKQP
ncbi:MAG: hypothetical protein ACLSHC_01020 [Bilophila wadsworthia]